MPDIIDSIELTSELIKCQSITPKSAGAIDLIVSYLEPLGFNCKKIDFGEGVKVSICRIGDQII